jgi:hypothetical protein
MHLFKMNIDEQKIVPTASGASTGVLLNSLRLTRKGSYVFFKSTDKFVHFRNAIFRDEPGLSMPEKEGNIEKHGEGGDKTN